MKPPPPPPPPPPTPPPPKTPPYTPFNERHSGYVLSYFLVLLLVCVFNTVFAVVIFRLVVKLVWTRCAKCCSNNATHSSDDYPAVSVLVPCYLPNEQRIIMSTIRHILKKLEYPAPITLFVVYNGCKDRHLEIQDKLYDEEKLRGWHGGNRLRVMNVEDSTSKADNLNAALKEVEDEFVAVYDADHHPDPHSLTMLMDRIRGPFWDSTERCDTVQGSVYIRQTIKGKTRGIADIARLALAFYIDAEFFIQHFIYFPTIEMLSTSGFFGGSNALWRTEVIRRYGLDKQMLTEDIHVSALAFLDNHNIVFCPEARSGELAPGNLKSLYRQRLRWVLGWEEVTLACTKLLLRSSLSVRRKLGFIFMFPTRWLLLFLSLFIAIFTPVLSLLYNIRGWSSGIEFFLMYSLYVYLVTMVLVLYKAMHFARLAQFVWILIFYMTVPGYLLFNTFLLVIAIAKIVTGNVGAWHITERESTGAFCSWCWGAKARVPGAGAEGAARDVQNGNSGSVRRAPSHLALGMLNTFQYRFNAKDEMLPEDALPSESNLVTPVPSALPTPMGSSDQLMHLAGEGSSSKKGQASPVSPVDGELEAPKETPRRFIKGVGGQKHLF